MSLFNRSQFNTPGFQFNAVLTHINTGISTLTTSRVLILGRVFFESPIPVYAGYASLTAKHPILIASGTGSIEGFIYKGKLYLTDQLINSASLTDIFVGGNHCV